MGLRTESFPTASMQTKTRSTWQKRWLTQETLIAWIFILPSLLGLLVFFIFPTLRGFYLSFTNSDLLTRADFIGLENYQKLIGDAQFWNSLRITTYYVVLNIPFQTALALLIATSLDRLTKSMLARGIVLLPFLIPMVMTTLVWMTLLDYELGPINGFLKLLGLTRIAFLNQDAIIPSLAWINIWRHAGYVTLLFYAGLQTIPQEIYEAAAIDGASAWRTFWSVTLPLLRPVTAFVLVTSVIGSFQVWDSVAVAAVPSGGPGGATRVIFWYITNLAFTRFNMGYAATVAVALFLICLVITFIQLRVLRANSSDLG